MLRSTSFPLPCLWRCAKTDKGGYLSEQVSEWGTLDNHYREVSDFLSVKQGLHGRHCLVQSARQTPQSDDSVHLWRKTACYFSHTSAKPSLALTRQSELCKPFLTWFLKTNFNFFPTKVETDFLFFFFRKVVYGVGILCSVLRYSMSARKDRTNFSYNHDYFDLI